MVREDLISVIIPVYNAEKYLDRCVESIVKQTYKNLEIIIVNDGSTDTSGQKCDEWEKKDNRIIVIHKPNSGVSDTRNLGMEKAKGKYFAFVDSDDYIDVDYMQTLYNAIIENEADIAVCNFQTMYEADEEKRKYNLISEAQVITDCSVLFSDCIDCKIYTYLVWGKLYKKEILKGMRFEKQAYSEDALFVREIFGRRPKVSLTTYSGYYYWISGNCVTSDKSRNLEKSMGELNMLWDTWISCRRLKLSVSYEVLEQTILRALKKVIGKSIKEVKPLSKYNCRLIKCVFENFSEFKNKGKGFGYLKFLFVFVLIISKIKKGKIKKDRKVGIVTIYDLDNYGNRLQNYATVQYLKKMGFEAETLIINQKSIKKSIRKIAELLRLKKKTALHWNVKQESDEYIKTLSELQLGRYDLFKEFSYRYCNVEKASYWKEFPEKLNKQYDYFITGSDQVWNPLIGQAVDWEFLSFAKSSKNISWSASFGISEIPDKYKQRFKDYLMNIDNISVRETAGVDIVNSLAGKKAELLIDPTMMISADEWRKLAKMPDIKVPDKYILSFFLGEQDEERRRQIKLLADKNGCEVINLLDKECDVLYKTGPAEFIYLIGNSSLICTDSFHACVFSILMDKPFYVFNRKGIGNNMNSRIVNLLSKFELTDRRFNESILDNANIEHNYERAYEILQVERRKAHGFLVESLR